MATQTTIRLVDDIDGGPADETVEFSIGRKAYLIDLSDTNAARLRDQLGEFVAAARRAGGASARRRPGRRQIVAAPAATPTPPPAAEGPFPTIREWARAHGYKLGDRGRIPQAVLAAHAKAVG